MLNHDGLLLSDQTNIEIRLRERSHASRLLVVSNSIDSLNSVTLLSCRVALSGVEFVFLNSNTFLSRRMVLPGVKAHLEVSLNLGRWRSLGRDRDMF